MPAKVLNNQQKEMPVIKVNKVMNGYTVTDSDGAQYICASFEEVVIRLKVLCKEITAVEAQFALDALKKAA